MAINALSSVTSSISSIAGIARQAGPDKAAGQGTGFGDMINNAIQQLDQVQKTADQASLQAANGQGADLHNAMIAVEEASLSFQLAMQVRNKIMDGYQEVMRMQV